MDVTAGVRPGQRKEPWGDADRAAFVRAQVAVATQGGEWRCSRAFWEAQKALWDANKQVWTAELPPWARFLPRFARGVLDSVSLTAQNFFRHGRKLFRDYPTVREVRLSNDDGRWPQLAACAALQSVRALELTASSLAETTALAASPHLGLLRSLSLRPNWPRLMDPPTLAALFGKGAFLTLEELQLDGHPFGDQGASHLGENAPARLRSLSVSSALLGPAAAGHLLPLLRRHGFRTLDARDNHLGDEGLAGLAASGPPGLESLCLAKNDITEAGLVPLHSGQFPRLSALDLSNNPIRGAAAAALVASPALPALSSLNLSYIELQESDIARLAEHPAAARLKELHLYGVPLSDDAVRLLARSPHLANLEVLDLSSAGWGDEAARALAASPHLANLRALLAYHNRFTAAGQQILSRRFSLWC